MLLNSALRSTIKHNALDAILKKEIAMAAREKKLALRCYNHAIPAAIRKAIATFNDAPGAKTAWFSYGRRFTFNVGGQKVLLDADTSLVEPRNYSPSWDTLGKAISLDDDPKLVEDVRAWQSDSEALKAERKAADKSLEVLLKSVRTTESLFKAWPEGKKFYSTPPLEKPITHLPAVQMDALNKMLGLEK